MEKSEIREFYKGLNVFLTGGTGFMGKALIEKLLRETEVETIFVLVREKKGKTSHMRIDEIFDDVIFDKLKKEKPKCRNKVESISGDCSITGLGMSITDRQRLISCVNVVFHVAATVNFNEHIKLAYSINVNGTRDVLDLARELTNLKSFVHVSTAYSNCYRSEIEEKIYDYPVKFSHVEAVLEKMTKHESDLCTRKILGEWPNTYTFTKALAESLIKERGNGLPIGIFRPGIVISTYKDPVPGWIDNLYGPTGVAVGTVSGLVRVLVLDKKKLADMVPVDTCVAGIIASGWDVAKREEEIRKTETIPVFNYVSSPENPICWEEFIKLNYTHGLEYAPSKAMWYPYSITTTNFYVYWVLKVLLHILPATCIDTARVVVGKKPRLLTLYRKIHKFIEIVTWFSLREWKFSNNNTQALWKKMNKTDQEIFPVSVKTISWLVMFRNYGKGIRVHFLKEDDSTLEIAKARHKRLKIAHQILLVSLIFLICNLVSFFFVRIYNLVFSSS